MNSNVKNKKFTAGRVAERLREAETWVDQYGRHAAAGTVPDDFLTFSTPLAKKTAGVPTEVGNVSHAEVRLLLAVS